MPPTDQPKQARVLKKDSCGLRCIVCNKFIHRNQEFLPALGDTRTHLVRACHWKCFVKEFLKHMLRHKLWHR